MSEEFFVQIENPLALRKDLLEASKDMVLALQMHEQLREKRIYSQELVSRFHKLMEEIYFLKSKLLDTLPAVPVVPTVKKVQKKIVVKKEPDKIETLHATLDDIEKKLSGL